ncbi:MAG: hypothetical protein KAI63_02740, partial [Planctomycetes bacterium]|nr:hypothetical protein [Planctomycetota bacterium]
ALKYYRRCAAALANKEELSGPERDRQEKVVVRLEVLGQFDRDLAELNKEFVGQFTTLANQSMASQDYRKAEEVYILVLLMDRTNKYARRQVEKIRKSKKK